MKLLKLVCVLSVLCIITVPSISFGSDKDSIIESYRDYIFDSYTLDDQILIKSHVKNGGICNSDDTKELGISAYNKLYNYHSSNNNSLLEFDDELTWVQERIDDLEYKKTLLDSWGYELTRTRELFDWTVVEETITYFDSTEKSRLDDYYEYKWTLEYQLRNYESFYRDAYREVLDEFDTHIFKECNKYLDDLKKSNQLQERKEAEKKEKEEKYRELYNRLDQIEKDKPGMLKKAIPLFENMIENPKYNNYIEILEVIIDYIENM